MKKRIIFLLAHFDEMHDFYYFSKMFSGDTLDTDLNSKEVILPELLKQVCCACTNNSWRKKSWIFRH